MANEDTPGALRERIRANTLGLEPELEARPLTLPSGDTVEVREPTEVQRQRIIKKAGVKMSGSGEEQHVELDMALARAACVVELTYIPGSNLKAFDAKDEDVLLKQSTRRGWFKQLADVAMELFSAGDEEAGKSETDTTAD